MRCCGSISLKNILIFPKNFVRFSLDTNEKQSVIKFNCRSKGFAFVVLSDFAVTSLREREDAAFYPFLDCILFIDSVA